MAILIFHDRTRRKVSYGQGATIYQILLGNKEPENKEQEAFVLTVAQVYRERLDPPATTHLGDSLLNKESGGNE